MRYNPAEIEPKWQRYWEENDTFKTEFDESKPKYYVLDMFPYPSGQGLHVGHPKGYVGSDIVARYKRMMGYDVLHPMGWDAFGLPAERQANKEGIHPSEVTKRNIEVFRRQLKMIGLGYDWSREFSTTDPKYYRWTQWIFLKLYEKGLVYQAGVPVNWCPALGTVLANEEVRDGVYIETGDPIEKRMMNQWMLRITAYADRLLQDLDQLDWPESVKEMQRNWIGRSEGARVVFRIEGSDSELEVFTTRPDTLFGCSFCILAPEHPMVSELVTQENRARVEDYVTQASKRLERERMMDNEPKTGVFTGCYALNPVNGEQVPIWIADYVLTGYGTGAIFGCPAHDERDYGFAKRFALPIIEVVSGGDISVEAYTGDGDYVNSELLNGLTVEQGKERIIDWLEEKGLGKREINYRLRDWLFSRQRYWGEPIPIIHLEDGSIAAVPESDLPLLLPHLDDITPTKDAEPPLSRATEWVQTVDPTSGKPARRETNTMPQWAGSCWYYLRFIDPKNDSDPWSPELEKRWMPVDLYIGGTEHATLHLLYARFWHKVLYDLGYVSTKEPFQRLFNQGMIQAQSYRDSRGKYYYPSEAESREGKWFAKDTGEELETRIEKMSKSRYNVVTPDEVIEKYGADCLRLYEMFVGPLEEDAVWQTENILGIRRFLERVWRLRYKESGEDATVEKMDELVDGFLHWVVKRVTEDIENLQMNTAISAMITFVNEATKRGGITSDALSKFVRLLSVFAPHIGEELWRSLGNDVSIAHTPWPDYDSDKVKDPKIEEQKRTIHLSSVQNKPSFGTISIQRRVIDKEKDPKIVEAQLSSHASGSASATGSLAVIIIVQVNGKLRGKVLADEGSSEDEVRKIAMQDRNVSHHLEGAEIRRVIYVPDKLLNFVVSKK